jgi:hypothetical protein
MKKLRRSKVVFLVAIFLLPPLVSEGGESVSDSCTILKSIPGIPYYDEFRVNHLSPDLPKELGLPDNSEENWVKAVLGLTIFTEARNENENSMATASFSILKRAGYGTSEFSIYCIPHAAVNSQYSQWTLTRQLKMGKTPAWIKRDCKASAACIEANNLIIEDPIRYAEVNDKKYAFIKKLRFAVNFASCLVDKLSSHPATFDPDLTRNFGTLFSQPNKIYTYTAYHPHANYLENQKLSYCANSKNSLGYCIKPAHFDKGDYKGHGMPMLYYSLSQPHSKEEIESLYSKVNVLVSSCQH